MGVKIDDNKLAVTLLASLPEYYKPLVSVLDAVGQGELSYENFKNMLLKSIVVTAVTMRSMPFMSDVGSFTM